MNREKPEEEDESEKQLRDDKLLSNEWSTSNGADLKRGGGKKKGKEFDERSIEIGSSLPMKWTWRWIMRDGLRGPAFNTVLLVRSLSFLFVVGYLQKKNPARLF